MNFEYVKTDPIMNKITAIKMVRDFSLQAFGTVSGLKESKDFVDSIVKKATAAAADRKYATVVRDALLAVNIDAREDMYRLFNCHKPVPFLRREEFYHRWTDEVLNRPF